MHAFMYIFRYSMLRRTFTLFDQRKVLAEFVYKGSKVVPQKGAFGFGFGI